VYGCVISYFLQTNCGTDTFPSEEKTLLIEQESGGRITVILVPETLGF
jgi:hypothetical protein